MTLAAGALIGFLTTLATPQDDQKHIQSAIRKFKEDYHKPGAREDDKIAAVNYLAQYKHEKIVKVLGSLMVEAPPSVRMIAARALSHFTEVDAAGRELAAALQAQPRNVKNISAVRIEILRALGALRCKPAGGAVSKLVNDRAVWIAKAAIDATGKIRISEAIYPLIKALQRIEGREGDAEVTVDPLDDLVEGVSKGDLFKSDPRQPKRPTERELLREPILKSLESITKQTFTSSREWDVWWGRNKMTFQVED